MKEKFTQLANVIKANRKEIESTVYISSLLFIASYTATKIGAYYGYSKGYKAGTVDAYNGIRDVMKSIGGDS